MKNFVIHLGIGRTGTTFLQDIFFCDLHKKKLINYIDNKSTYYKQFKDLIYSDNEIYSKNKKNKILKKLITDNNIINLISDETLLPFKHQQISFRLFYSRLFEIFDNPQVIITVREQKSAIVSYYLSNHYIVNNKYISFSDFFDKLNSQNFNFRYISLLKYKNIFGYFLENKKNLSILVYEEMKKQDNYILKWFEILNIDNYNYDLKINNKTTNNTTSLVFNYRKIVYSYKIFKYFHSFISYFFKIIGYDFNKFILSFKGSSKVIYLTKNQKDTLDKLYEPHNKYLQNNFGINLKNFNYKI